MATKKKVPAKPVKKSAPPKKAAAQKKAAPKKAAGAAKASKPTPNKSVKIAQKPAVKASKPAAKPVKVTPKPSEKNKSLKKVDLKKEASKKKEEKKPENKKSTPKPVVKAEAVKAAAKKPEAKKPEVKAEAKPEVKSETKPVTAPKAATKAAPKATPKKAAKAPEAKPAKLVMPEIKTKTVRKYEPEFTRSVLDKNEAEPQLGPTLRYSDSELVEFKELIQKKYDQAKKELTYLQGLITRKDEMGGGENESRYMTMEDGSMSMEREQLSQMASRQINYIDHLEKALIRIENKTYGICRVTGKLIDKARLRAVPHATLSIEAKQTMNR